MAAEIGHATGLAYISRDGAIHTNGVSIFGSDETIDLKNAINSLANGCVTASFVYGEAIAIDATFFVAARAYIVKAITVRPLVVGSDASAVTAQIRKAPSGTAMASGTVLHSSTADLKGAINTNQALTLSSTAADLAIASGDAIGIDVTGTLTAARGVVTVLLAPA